MAGPWEAYATKQPDDGPWAQYAQPERTVVDKLAGQGGERYQTWPERLARSVISSVSSGASLPGDVYSGKTQVDPANPEFVGRTLELAGAGTPLAPRAVSNLAASKGGIPTSEALRSASDVGYDAARNSSLIVKADAVKGVAANIQRDLEQKGILGEFAPDTYTVLKKLQNPAEGAFATGSNLISAREALRNASQNFTNPREAKAANDAIRELDRFIESVPAESVVAGTPAEFAKIASDARGNYAASRRSDQVTGQLEEAQGNAAAANSGQNIGNAVRQRFNAIVKSDKKSSGFTEQEIAQAEKVRDGTVLGNTTRLLGNVLGGGGGLGAVATAATGAATLGPVGAAAPLVGYGLKKLSDASVNRQVRALDEMTRARSPLAQTDAYRVAQRNALQEAMNASPAMRRSVYMAMMEAAKRQFSGQE